MPSGSPAIPLGSVAPATVQSRTLQALFRMGGREIAIKLLAFAGWIVLARLLTPATFGLFAVMSFAINLLALFSEVGLGASMIRGHDPPSQNDLDRLFTYQLLWSLVVGGLLLLGGAWLRFGLGLGDAGIITGGAGIIGPVIALRTVPAILAQRALNYGPIAFADLAAQGAFWVFAIVSALAGLGGGGVLAAGLAFALAGTGVLYARTGYRPRLRAPLDGRRPPARFSLMYHSQSAASLAKYGMLFTLGGVGYGTAGVGYITWAHQVAVVPIQLIQLVSRVTFPALAHLQNDPSAFRGLTDSTLRWVGRFTFPACAVLLGLGPGIIRYVYGPKWEPALGLFVLFLANSALSVPAGVLGPALYSLGRARAGLRISIGLTTLTWTVAIALMAVGAGPEALAVAFLTSTLGADLATLYALRDLGGAGLLSPLLAPFTISLAGGCFLFLASPPLVHGLLSLVLLGSAAAVLMVLCATGRDLGMLARHVRRAIIRAEMPGTAPGREDRSP